MTYNFNTKENATFGTLRSKWKTDLKDCYVLTVADADPRSFLLYFTGRAKVSDFFRGVAGNTSQFPNKGKCFKGELHADINLS